MSPFNIILLAWGSFCVGFVLGTLWASLPRRDSDD